MASPGHVGFISQSGALCTAVLDWSLSENVGFSAFVSIGSMVDVGWGDLINYLGSDPQTNCIVIYMETIGYPPVDIGSREGTVGCANRTGSPIGLVRK